MVPVIYKNVPLMPCTPKRARKMIEKGEATPFFKCGIFCIRLNKVPSGTALQPIIVGIDPGSKKEGYSVASAKRTLLNIQSDAITWVKDKIQQRKEMRRSRRNRKTPCRQNRINRKIGGIAPSTFARWNLKLRILNIINKLYPITTVIVEDIKAITFKNGKKWNQSFSPLEVGKNWFYEKIKEKFDLKLVQGFETSELRKSLNLKKLSNKLSNDWHAHCVDAWVIANSVVGAVAPTTKRVLLLHPMNFIRRQLHKLQPSKGGYRGKYGGTCGRIKKGAIILHDGELKVAGGCQPTGLELKNMQGKRVNKIISFKKVKVIVPYNSFGWEYA